MRSGILRLIRCADDTCPPPSECNIEWNADRRMDILLNQRPCVIPVENR